MEVFENSGFRMTKRFADGIYCVNLDLMEKTDFLKQLSLREHVARSAGVRRVIYPKNVAVIGTSRNPHRIGGALFHNILSGNFKGTLFPVNPNAPSIGGVLAYPSVLGIPMDVDLAVIIVPADRVLDVVDQCGEKGVKGLVIISAGFGEGGEEGKRRERKLREKVIAYGMRAVGPNSLGILNADPDICLNATFSPYSPPTGSISIGTQSGALGLALLDHVKNYNLGIAHFVSIGNQMDISSNDLLEFWEDDENTDVVLLYLESFGDPGRFSRIARRLTKKKPIVAVKSGRSAVGARAASSHTGALAAFDVAVDAMFKQAGVIRVDTLQEMFNVAEALAYQHLPAGPRVGILTNAGGPGILVADASTAVGLNIPQLSTGMQEKLRTFLPEEASLANPVDMIASATPDHYRQALSYLLDCPEIDAVILIYIPVLVTRPEEISAAVRDVLTHYEGHKPVLASFMMSEKKSIDLSTGPGRHIPNYTFPEDAVQALSRAYQYSRYLQQDEGSFPRFPDIDPSKIRKEVLPTVLSDDIGVWLYPETAASLLREYGIPSVKTATAFSAEEAARMAGKTGFPLVMKIRSSSIVHKTDVGGVVLDVTSEKEVVDSFNEMKVRLKDSGSEEEMEGVILQPMARKGLEVIIGMSHDPLFGPLIMVGLGGVLVELFKDVAFSLHPLTDMDCRRMVKQLKSFPLLEGWRGSPPRDIEAIINVLLRFSALVEDFPEIDQMEINPLIVYEKGEGCMAVDTRIFMKGKGKGD
jgi:acetyl coenzyme A synthetase (ADP forming)-like protein